MTLKMKIAVARTKLFMNNLHKEAQKIALAVIILEYIIAIGYYQAEKNGYLEFLESKTIYIETAQAKELSQKLKKSTENVISDTERIADTIYTIESTQGKNNYSKCEAIGEVNGIGYGIPGDGKYVCFKNHAEEMKTLKNWIETKKSQGMEEKELMCFYNTGHKSGEPNGEAYREYCQ
jgi:hypothetical protein